MMDRSYLEHTIQEHLQGWQATVLFMIITVTLMRSVLSSIYVYLLFHIVVPKTCFLKLEQLFRCFIQDSHQKRDYSSTCMGDDLPAYQRWKAWNPVLSYKAGGSDDEVCSQTPSSRESLEFFMQEKYGPLDDFLKELIYVKEDFYSSNRNHIPNSLGHWRWPYG